MSPAIEVDRRVDDVDEAANALVSIGGGGRGACRSIASFFPDISKALLALDEELKRIRSLSSGGDPLMLIEGETKVSAFRQMQIDVLQTWEQNRAKNEGRDRRQNMLDVMTVIVQTPFVYQAGILPKSRLNAQGERFEKETPFGVEAFMPRKAAEETGKGQDSKATKRASVVVQSRQHPVSICFTGFPTSKLAMIFSEQHAREQEGKSFALVHVFKRELSGNAKSYHWDGFAVWSEDLVNNIDTNPRSTPPTPTASNTRLYHYVHLKNFSGAPSGPATSASNFLWYKETRKCAENERKVKMLLFEPAHDQNNPKDSCYRHEYIICFSLHSISGAVLEDDNGKASIAWTQPIRFEVQKRKKARESDPIGSTALSRPAKKVQLTMTDRDVSKVEGVEIVKKKRQESLQVQLGIVDADISKDNFSPLLSLVPANKEEWEKRKEFQAQNLRPAASWIGKLHGSMFKRIDKGRPTKMSQEKKLVCEDLEMTKRKFEEMDLIDDSAPAQEWLNTLSAEYKIEQRIQLKRQGSDRMESREDAANEGDEVGVLAQIERIEEMLKQISITPEASEAILPQIPAFPDASLEKIGVLQIGSPTEMADSHESERKDVGNQRFCFLKKGIEETLPWTFWLVPLVRLALGASSVKVLSEEEHDHVLFSPYIRSMMQTMNAQDLKEEDEQQDSHKSVQEHYKASSVAEKMASNVTMSAEAKYIFYLFFQAAKLRKLIQSIHDRDRVETVKALEILTQEKNPLPYPPESFSFLARSKYMPLPPLEASASSGGR